MHLPLLKYQCIFHLASFLKIIFLITIQIPDTAGVLELADTELSAGWRSNPHPDSTQKIGDEFVLALQHLVLRVPSAVVPGEFNYFLNPLHPTMKEVTIANVEAFEFESRFAYRGR